jgi:hypothetical protein
LHRTNRFAKVEADVPIRVYAEQETVAEEIDVGAFALPLRWVHDILNWDAALAVMPVAAREVRAFGSGTRIPATLTIPT